MEELSKTMLKVERDAFRDVAQAEAAAQSVLEGTKTVTVQDDVRTIGDLDLLRQMDLLRQVDLFSFHQRPGCGLQDDVRTIGDLEKSYVSCARG